MEDLESELITALLKDTKDKDYLKEIDLWDCEAGDGIEVSQ